MKIGMVNNKNIDAFCFSFFPCFTRECPFEKNKDDSRRSSGRLQPHSNLQLHQDSTLNYNSAIPPNDKKKSHKFRGVLDEKTWSTGFLRCPSALILT